MSKFATHVAKKSCKNPCEFCHKLNPTKTKGFKTHSLEVAVKIALRY